MGATNSRVRQLHTDCAAGNTGSAATILSEGNVDINSVLDDDGETILQKAAKAGHLEVIDLLLQFEGTPALEINKGDSDGATALHKSAAAGKINVVKRLCRDERLDMNAVDRYGETALHDACARENREATIKELVQCPGVDTNTRSHAGTTPLHKAVGENLCKNVEELITAHNIDINSRDRYGDTPLHDACSKEGCEAIIRVILSKATIDMNAQAHDGATCLHRSAAKGRASNIGVLLSAPSTIAVDINATDAQGDTALHLAIRGNHIMVVEMLLNIARIQTKIPNSDGLTSRLLASRMAEKMAKQIPSGLSLPSNPVADESAPLTEKEARASIRANVLFVSDTFQALRSFSAKGSRNNGSVPQVGDNLIAQPFFPTLDALVEAVKLEFNAEGSPLDDIAMDPSDLAMECNEDIAQDEETVSSRKTTDVPGPPVNSGSRMRNVLGSCFEMNNI